MPNTTPYRVVQWTTGNVGKSSVAAIASNPTLELVGCYAWSEDKVGRDVGELAGIDPLGVAATNDVDALLALKPDVVVYNPMWIDVDELVTILAAGVNVVATASFITGHNQGAGRDKIAEACDTGGSTMFGSGVSPGYVNLLSIVAAGHLRSGRQDHHRRVRGHHVLRLAGDRAARRLRQADRRPRPAADDGEGHRGVRRGGRMIADALGVELDEIHCEAEYAQTTEDLDWGRGPSRRVTSRACTPAGRASSTARRSSRSTVRWKKGQTLEPDWQIDRDGWKITIDGRPTVNMQVGFLPPPDFEATTLEDFMVLGHIMTAMPPINAIAAVVAAAPGIVTYADLPLTLPKGVVPKGVVPKGVVPTS